MKGVFLLKKKTFPIEEVKELINKGDRIVDIANYFGVSRALMGRWLKENNLQTKVVESRKRIKELNEDDIAKEYQEGKCVREICEKYNISDSVVERILDCKGISRRTNSEVHTIYPCDKDYFKHIDSMDKSYLLGFLCADGFVTDRNEVGIGIKKDDINVLYFFKEQLKSNKNIYFKPDGTSAELRVQNKELTQDLIKYGVVPRKSLIIDIGSVIEKAELNEKQIKAFLLGYYDGDGGIYHYIPSEELKKEKGYYEQWHCSVTGTYETCSYYKSYFNGIGYFTQRHPERNNNNYTYQIGGTNLVRNALSSLYEIKDELSFYYDRQYKKFKELCMKSPNK